MQEFDNIENKELPPQDSTASYSQLVPAEEVPLGEISVAEESQEELRPEPELEIKHVVREVLNQTTVGSTEDAPVVLEDSELVTVQPVKFANFEKDEFVVGTPRKNIDIMQDVNIKITVELGRTKMKVRKVLDMTKGTIIEINKVAGEQVELYVCGKLVAYGEVIVIEDKFGLRITSIAETRTV